MLRLGASGPTARGKTTRVFRRSLGPLPKTSPYLSGAQGLKVFRFRRILFRHTASQNGWTCLSGEQPAMPAPGNSSLHHPRARRCRDSTTQLGRSQEKVLRPVQRQIPKACEPPTQISGNRYTRCRSTAPCRRIDNECLTQMVRVLTVRTRIMTTLRCGQTYLFPPAHIRPSWPVP